MRLVSKIIHILKWILCIVIVFQSSIPGEIILLNEGNNEEPDWCRYPSYELNNILQLT